MEAAAKAQFGTLSTHAHSTYGQFTDSLSQMTEFENNISLVNPERDGAYKYDAAQQKYVGGLSERREQPPHGI
jgi:hypothetical protein